MPAIRKKIFESFRWKKLRIPVIVIIGLVIAGAVIWNFIPRAGATLRSVAVLSFENLTRDNSYDYLRKAIPNLLITSLEQSKHLQVMSWEKLSDFLKQKGKNETDLIDRDLGFEVCRQESIEAVVLGSFTKSEEMLATDIKVCDVETKNIIKSAGSKGEGVGSILRKQIDELSKEISRSVGLPERVISADLSPIIEAATSSIEAYNDFLRGKEDIEKYDMDGARCFLERAVEKDPEFGLAYFYLARVCCCLDDAPKASEALEKFQKCRKKVSGKDSLYVNALLARVFEKNDEKYMEILKEIEKEYPEDKRVHVDLAVCYERMKMFDEAVNEYSKAIELDPNFGHALNSLACLYIEMGNTDKALEYFRRYALALPEDPRPFDSMGDIYFTMGKFDEAKKNYEKALDIKPGFETAWKLAYLYASGEDYDNVMKWIDHYIANASSDSVRARGYQWTGFYYHLRGNLKQALSELDKAEELAKAVGDTELADITLRGKTWTCYEWGKSDLCQKYLEKRVDYRNKVGRGSPTLNEIYRLYYLGILDLRRGMIEQAKAKQEEIATLAATTPQAEKYLLEIGSNHLKREILLAEGAWDEAVQVFENAPPVQLSLSAYMSVQQKNLPYIQDFPARVYLNKGERDKAVAEYERLVSPDPSLRQQALIHPFSRYRLAKLYEEQGERLKAIEQYERVLKVWKNADPGLSEVEEARRRLARLKQRI
jgi:tetratricopeptide (TPR) repeat protein